ncbi:hypothetical protein P879_06823 [Paragonimus westermani]|uniref:Uncharacterized protein n=1 Tax=Paragonimus westermani TaxID=34504 RepID=A0A8T0DTA7_9TREM|nr:hypothetical protein P879_06823 [Paragonimus westermani]
MKIWPTKSHWTFHVFPLKILSCCGSWASHVCYNPKWPPIYDVKPINFV